MAIGIQVKYGELFSLQIEQIFYLNKRYKKTETNPFLNFTFKPSDETIILLKRLDWLVKTSPFKGGISVLSNIEGETLGGDELLRYRPKVGEKLAFFILSQNPEISTIHDLLPLENGKAYYLNNLVNDASALRDNLHLTKDANSVDSALDTIKISAATYLYQHNAAVNEGTAKVVHNLTGKEVYPIALTVQAGKSNLSYDLSLLPLGKCQLLINNTPTDEFYYVGKNIPPSLFGVVELILSPSVLDKYRIIETDGSLKAQKPCFTIPFRNRKTFWRYTVHLQSISPLRTEMLSLNPADKADFLNRLNVVTNDTALAFQKVAATDDQLVFVSLTPISLQEKYVSSSSSISEGLNLTLKKYIGNMTKEASVKTFLPFPSTGFHTIQSSTVYSDIFITL